jgi:hypothetical protein
VTAGAVRSSGRALPDDAIARAAPDSRGVIAFVFGYTDEFIGIYIYVLKTSRLYLLDFYSANIST